MSSTQRGLSESDLPSTGSPDFGEPVYLAIGRLGKPHGLDGGVIFYVITDFPERLKKGKIVYIGDNHIPAKLYSVKEHSRGLIFRFQEFKSLEEIEKYKNSFVYVKTDDLPALPKGEYYHHQLIGMEVKDTAGNYLGKIKEILQTGANDVYVISDEENKEILYPALLNLIETTDLKQKLMVVKPLEFYNKD